MMVKTPMRTLQAEMVSWGRGWKVEGGRVRVRVRVDRGCSTYNMMR